MLALRSPAPALALLGACLSACFADTGAPALSTAPSTSDVSVGATLDTDATGATAASSTTGTTATATTAEATTTGTTAEPTTDEPSTTGPVTTGCVLTVWYFDVDKDGYGGPKSTEDCGPPPPGFTVDSLDCNDSVPTIHPGADELCDQVDNDCDGGVDEYPAGSMEACNGCQAILDADSTYYFCSAPLRTWDDARIHCKTLLGDLAIVSPKPENAFIRQRMVDLGLNLMWWLGLSDSAIEGQFVWVDGSPLDPNEDVWMLNEPDNDDPGAPGPANCVAMIGDGFPEGYWRDQVCDNPSAAVCEAWLF